MQKLPKGLRTSQPTDNPYLLLVNYLHKYSVTLLDTRGYLRSWPPAASQLFGYQPEEVIGQPFSLFFSESAVAEAKPEEELLASIQTGCLTHTDWRVKKNKALFCASVYTVPLFTAAQQLIGFSMVTQNLSEWERVLASLPAPDKTAWRRIQQVTDLAFVVLDAHGYIVNWDAGAKHLFGQSAQEMIGTPWARTYPAQQVRDGTPLWELEQAFYGGGYERVGIRFRADELAFWAKSVITPVFTANRIHKGYAVSLISSHYGP